MNQADSAFFHGLFLSLPPHYATFVQGKFFQGHNVTTRHLRDVIEIIVLKGFLMMQFGFDSKFSLSCNFFDIG
jgi:hypothetical protein